MKTKVLLLGAVVIAFALTSFAAEPLLTPRADGSQIKRVSSLVATPTVTITYIDSSTAFLTPRATGNQIKTVKGGNNDVNPATACQKNMGGSPKVVAECSAHTTMPGCATVVMDK